MVGPKAAVSCGKGCKRSGNRQGEACRNEIGSGKAKRGSLGSRNCKSRSAALTRYLYFLFWFHESERRCLSEWVFLCVVPIAWINAGLWIFFMMVTRMMMMMLLNLFFLANQGGTRMGLCVWLPCMHNLSWKFRECLAQFLKRGQG